MCVHVCVWGQQSRGSRDRQYANTLYLDYSNTQKSSHTPQVRAARCKVGAQFSDSSSFPVVADTSEEPGGGELPTGITQTEPAKKDRWALRRLRQLGRVAYISHSAHALFVSLVHRQASNPALPEGVFSSVVLLARNQARGRI